MGVGSALESTAAAPKEKGCPKGKIRISASQPEEDADVGSSSSGGVKTPKRVPPKPKSLGISSKAKSPARPNAVASSPAFDLEALCNDIYDLENLEPGKWKQGTADVYKRIMTDDGLDQCLKAPGGAKKQQQLS